MTFILASNSPRRRQLLSLTGWEFTVAVADVDETPLPNEAPADYVLRLAQTKARAIAAHTHDGHLILAADTTVADGREILGKPADEAEAIKMLTQLRGRTHQVYTAIALLRKSDDSLLTDLCVTDVPMRLYTDDEIRAYVASGDPFDKAGAYAIQHDGFHPVARMDGCYASVMGLPLCHLVRLMRRMDTLPGADVPSNCQKALAYHCPIFPSILHEEVYSP